MCGIQMIYALGCTDPKMQHTRMTRRGLAKGRYQSLPCKQNKFQTTSTFYRPVTKMQKKSVSILEPLQILSLQANHRNKASYESRDSYSAGKCCVGQMESKNEELAWTKRTVISLWATYSAHLARFWQLHSHGINAVS